MGGPNDENVVIVPGWTFDERTHAGREHFDPDYVSFYDRKARTDVGEDVELLRELGLDKDHTVVDLGAGTGTFSVAIAPRCRRVVAVDPSPAMLHALTGKAAAANVENVECVQAGFLTYEHAGDAAHVVYSRNALHHLPDFWKALALARVAAMLEVGGVLRLRDVVFCFDAGEANSCIERWLASAAGHPDVGWTRPELEEHLRDEYSTFSWLLEPMLERAGFAIRDSSYSSSKMYAAYMCGKLPT